MASSHDVDEPAMDPVLATSCDGDSSSEFSDDSSNTDDALFVDDTPSRQALYPAQYSMAFTQGNLSPEEPLACGALEIYREVVILDSAGRSGAYPWIRLLRIKPGMFSHPLYCKIVKRPLWDAGEYIALSYSWGKDQLHQEIFIENQTSLSNRFRVSLHLWNALQRLREEQCVVNVWIDAICIDQQNYVERAAQVTIMAQIFNLASEVRVWLGEVGIVESGESTDAKLFWSLCEQPSPWWTRLWILQEFAYAKDCPNVMLGAHLMSFERLIERWHAVTLLDRELEVEQLRMLAATFKLLRTPFDIWTAQKDYEHRRPLLQRLQETAGRKCTDPRDRIYALLSLINESDAKQLRPDYRKPYQELVLEVAEVLRQSPSWNERHDNGVFAVLRPDAVVRTILSDVNTAAKFGMALAQALHDGNFKLIRALLRKCVTLRASQSPNAPTIYSASQSGRGDVVKLLADEVADIDAQIYSFALLKALEQRYEQVVEMLIEAGAVVATPHLEGRNASQLLQTASSLGLEKAVWMLIKAGANVNGPQGWHGSALHAAITEGHENIVEMLIGAGANVNAPHKQYSNALQAASYRGLEKSVRMLIEAGANVNAPRGNFGSALQEASFRGHEKVVKILVDAGANVNAREEYYGNAPQTASGRGHERVEEGADVNASGGAHDYALYAASCLDYKEVVEMLINRKAHINTAEGRDTNSLQTALSERREEVANILVDAGWDVNAQSGGHL